MTENVQEDYDLWLGILEYTNCVYVDEICFYYNDGHGYGQNDKIGGSNNLLHWLREKIINLIGLVIWKVKWILFYLVNSD